MRSRTLCAVVGVGLLAAGALAAQALSPVSNDAAKAARPSALPQSPMKETQAMHDQDSTRQNLAASSQPASSQPPTSRPGGHPRVVMQTSQGAIVIELYPDKAPLTVENFLKYVDSGFYTNTIFHRVIANFMIQGGGFSRDNEEKATRPPIRNESRNGVKNERGSIAMARTSDPNSATAQFYINVVDNPNLDYPSFDGYGYAVFGKVVQGMDVVDKIRNVPTGKARFVPLEGSPQMFPDVPKTPVVIESAKRQ